MYTTHNSYQQWLCWESDIIKEPFQMPLDSEVEAN